MAQGKTIDPPVAPTSWNRPVVYGSSLVLLLLTASSIWVIHRRNSEYAATGGSGLTVDEADLDFGEVRAQSRFRWKLPIHNPTDEPIEITQFTATCTCTSIEPAQLTIPPGESEQIELILDLRPTSAEDHKIARRPFDVNVFAYTKKASKKGEGWRVRGVVRPNPLNVEPGGLQFGTELVAGSPFSSKNVIVSSEAPLESLSARIEPEGHGFVTVTPSEHEPDVYLLDVVPSETLPRGSVYFDVVVDAVLATGETLPAHFVPVAGEIVGDVQPLPQALLLGSRPIGDVVTETLTLSSQTDREFTVLRVESSSKSLSVAMVSKPSNSRRAPDDTPTENGRNPVLKRAVESPGNPFGSGFSLEFHIRQEINRPGAQENEIAFFVQEKETSAESPVRFAVSYYGLESVDTGSSERERTQ